MDARPGLKVAYVALWLPEPSQTFVLDEVNTLYQLGLEVEVFTLYGPRSPRRLAGLPPLLPPATRFGSRSLPQLLKNLTQVHAQFGPWRGEIFSLRYCCAAGEAWKPRAKPGGQPWPALPWPGSCRRGGSGTFMPPGPTVRLRLPGWLRD